MYGTTVDPLKKPPVVPTPGLAPAAPFTQAQPPAAPRPATAPPQVAASAAPKIRAATATVQPNALAVNRVQAPAVPLARPTPAVPAPVGDTVGTNMVRPATPQQAQARAYQHSTDALDRLIRYPYNNQALGITPEMHIAHVQAMAAHANALAGVGADQTVAGMQFNPATQAAQINHLNAQADHYRAQASRDARNPVAALQPTRDTREAHINLRIQNGEDPAAATAGVDAQLAAIDARAREARTRGTMTPDQIRAADVASQKQEKIAAAEDYGKQFQNPWTTGVRPGVNPNLGTQYARNLVRTMSGGFMAPQQAASLFPAFTGQDLYDALFGQ